GPVMAGLRRAAPWLWGAVVALVLCRFFFLFGPGEFYFNHENWMYPCRVTEFLASLRAGYLFPQWAVDFRGGLRRPYFGYCQPGFFYAAAPFAAVLPVVRALGATLLVFSFLGYAGIFSLVRGRFGTAAGVLAGTVLLGSEYSVIDVYFRGDYSEYAGMM